MGILMETTEANLGTAGYRRQVRPELFGAMGAPGEFFPDTLHGIAINTRETEFGSIVEPIPITLKTYKHLQAHGRPLNGYGIPQQQMVTTMVTAPLMHDVEIPSTANFKPSLFKEEKEAPKVAWPPPKKKWIKDYLEEEPKSPVSVRVVTALPVTPRSNGVVRAASPVPVVATCAPAAIATAPAPSIVTLEPVASVPPPAPLLDFAQEHSRPRTTSNSHGLPSQIPSPPSVGSNGSVSSSNSGSGSSGNGSAPRSGTREVHNKLEKNRRAHLKECFELLKRQLPATPDDKKTSNLSILRSAIRYIQVLRRKERDCEHEMERLAREKIAAQQRLSALKREISVRTVCPRSVDTVSDDKDREDTLNGVLGIPISITASPPRSNVTRMETSPPRTLNLSTKLRTLPIQITPTTSQVVRTSYGTRPSTLTLTTLAPADHSAIQNGQALENGVTNALGATLVHPAQIHLPISQMVGGGGLVVGGALQLLSAGAPLRVLQAPLHTNGMTAGDNGRIPEDNGIVSPTPVTTTDGSSGVVVSGLTPLMVSQPAAHLLHTHTLTHKMVETQMVKGSVAPLTVSAQYLSATTIMKPVVVVSSAGSTHAPGAPNT